MKKIVFLFVFLNLNICVQSNKEIFCYFNAKIPSSTIDLSRCTSIVFRPCNIMPAKHTVRCISVIENEIRNVAQVTEKRNLDLKLLILVKSDAKTYSAMARSESQRRIFIQSAVGYIQTFKLNGLVIDWANPSYQDHDNDRDNMVILLDQLRNKLTELGNQRNASYQLSISVSPHVQHDNGYNFESIEEIVDYILVPAFHFSGLNSNPKQVAYHAPLKQVPDAPSAKQNQSVDFLINSYLIETVNLKPEKLILGIRTYATTYELEKATNHEPFSAFVAEGKYQTDGLPKGVIGYESICRKLNQYESHGPTIYRDCKYWMAPYLLIQNGKTSTWVSYEDERSVAIKAEYVKANNLSGVFMDSIDFDDTAGACLGDKFPLLNSVYKRFHIESD